ncbi:MAG: hypothetical protein QOG87_2100 [Actinomycetota bacterium]|jgi:hypothetical protein
MGDEVWLLFLQQMVLARGYAVPYELAQGKLRKEDALPGPENPVLEKLLTSLLFVRLASLLDEYLDDYAGTNNITIGAKRPKLFDRIEALRSHLEDPDRLHDLRKERRPLAHEAAAECSWDELDAAVAVVHAELEALGFVGDRPDYVLDSEWEYLEVDPPTVERRGAGVIETTSMNKYTVGVKSDGAWVNTYNWYTANTIIRGPREGE